MKRILSALLLVVFLVPAYSQKTSKERKEKRHFTTSLSFFRDSQNHFIKKQALKGFGFGETGSLALRNNAYADSVLVYMNMDLKSDNLLLLAKELPTYVEGSFLVKEVETWYAEEWWKDFIPSEKTIAFYNENEELVRYEVYYWNMDQWYADYAEELILNEAGEEVFYAWYQYDEATQEWEIMDGYRAVEQLNENEIVSERVWEYYMTDKWIPEYKEIYLFNDEDVVSGITEYVYEESTEKWIESYKVIFELGDDNTWISGNGYEWDPNLSDWFPAFQYVDIEWYDFSLSKISNVITLVNADYLGNEGWDKSIGEEDIEWLNFMKTRGNYHEHGKLALMEMSMWDETDWLPVMKIEQSYDHHQSMIFDAESAYDPVEDEWTILYGFKMDMEYNEDGSIKKANGFVAFDDGWKTTFNHMVRYEYYYPEDATNIPVVQSPEIMRVFPNPATSHLTMVWDGTDDLVNLTIMSIDGKIVKQYDQYPAIMGQQISLDVSYLQKGVYMVYGQGKNRQSVARFIKK
ncbi:MAG: T9SS type A sorting domain-containing protein [Bacteroidota bacterium]